MTLFKKESSKEEENEETINYSMAPRHGHGQDVVDENGIRQVAGCLPIDVVSKRFLLVTSSSHPDVWVIPKGGWEKDETQKQAAMRETWEEAGVKGVINKHLGVFTEKSKNGVKAHHWIYEMEIKEVTKKFPEQKKRARRWFTYDEAMVVVKAHYIKDAISMSSLSPSVHSGDEEKKKKKKKEGGDDKEKKKEKKKHKKKGSEEDDDEEEEEKKKKKKNKKKDSDEEENDEDDKEEKKKKKGKKKDSDKDEEGSEEDKKKKKKKNKKKDSEGDEDEDKKMKKKGSEDDEEKKEKKKKDKKKYSEDEGIEINSESEAIK
ncbi:hypothetical protein G6F37_010277 [Rhizopus arrhizus]|nr:hypothetical protein G6F38_008473 [Rhizopus arrhizus]KAG1153525.1 hypothetical protein G6F37_010277 [Rhizopus arrhizus]